MVKVVGPGFKADSALILLSLTLYVVPAQMFTKSADEMREIHVKRAEDDHNAGVPPHGCASLSLFTECFLCVNISFNLCRWTCVSVLVFEVKKGVVGLNFWKT